LNTTIECKAGERQPHVSEKFRGNVMWVYNTLYFFSYSVIY